MHTRRGGARLANNQRQVESTVALTETGKSDGTVGTMKRHAQVGRFEQMALHSAIDRASDRQGRVAKLASVECCNQSQMAVTETVTAQD